MAVKYFKISWIQKVKIYRTQTVSSSWKTQRRTVETVESYRSVHHIVSYFAGCSFAAVARIQYPAKQFINCSACRL